MDLSAEHQRDDEEAEVEGEFIKFAPEDEARIRKAQGSLRRSSERLAAISNSERGYGLPDDLDRVGLLVGLAELLAQKGVITRAELAIYKAEAMAAAAEELAEMAEQHKRSQSRLVVADGIRPAPGAPPFPPRKQRRR